MPIKDDSLELRYLKIGERLVLQMRSLKYVHTRHCGSNVEEDVYTLTEWRDVPIVEKDDA